jgi:hypothetical protein
MPKPLTQAKPNPTGTHTIRLADIPLNTRRTAALRLMRNTNDTAEWVRLYELVFNPGDASGRVAT